jgi:hypothetical protein
MKRTARLNIGAQTNGDLGLIRQGIGTQMLMYLADMGN